MVAQFAVGLPKLPSETGGCMLPGADWCGNYQRMGLATLSRRQDAEVRARCQAKPRQSGANGEYWTGMKRTFCAILSWRERFARDENDHIREESR